MKESDKWGNFMEKSKLRPTEMIARGAFGGADWLKVQSQHERFLKEIENLTDEDKANEIANAIKYLVQNKSDYWLECAHLLDLLLGDKEREGLYKIIDSNISKKVFCKKYLDISYKTANAYVNIIRHFEDYGFNEEQIRVLGFTKTQDLLSESRQRDISTYSSMNLDELKKIRREQIRSRMKRTPFEKLVFIWEKTPKEDRNKFLRFINVEKKDSDMD